MGVATGLGFQVGSVGITLIILIILRSTQVREKALSFHSDHEEE